MPAQSLISRSLPGFAACALITGLLWLRPGADERLLGSSTTMQAQANNSKGKYLGAEYCALCHKNGPVANFNDDYVLLTEYKTWSEKDKHAKAYKVLTEPRAKQIGTLMAIQDVTKDARCLNCHCANVPRDQREEAAGQAYKIEDGVSCDACHGPSSNWIVPHSLQSWRTKPMAEKEALGMNDVRDPAKRARLCFSCHIGNVSEGKLVTHEMYAAGHPPLPGIEMATFSRAMPPHWRYMRDKKPAIQALLNYDPKELEQTKLTVIGGVVALESSAALLERPMESGLDKTDRNKSWPELALFDCYACHHELRVPSWRQARGYSGKPGRPQPRSWPTALVKPGISALGSEKELASYQQLEKQLQAAFDGQPFGEPGQVASCAGALRKRSLQLEEELNHKRGGFEESAAKRLLQELSAQGAREIVDYDSARQMAWAFRVIYNELNPKAGTDLAIEEKLEALKQMLRLKLPSGQQQQILIDLPSMLEKIADYDPEKFKKLFGELSHLLHGK